MCDILLRPGERAGIIQIPSSKSAVHRLLICAALGSKSVQLQFDGLSKDIAATANCLRALGAGIEIETNRFTVTPAKKTAGDVLLPCGESGSTLRFLLPVAGALGCSGTFQMEGRLPERPMQAYEDLLRSHGMEIMRCGDRLHFSGRLSSGAYLIPGDISSQYFSGLLMTLPLLQGDSRIVAEGILESAPYIRMTEDALSLSDIAFQKKGEAEWDIPGGQRFALPSPLSAEGDWSNAAFFLCMGALSEKGVTVGGLSFSSSQGDREIADLLVRFGAEVTCCAEQSAVTVKKKALRPMEIDAAAVPDLVPVLSVLCCGAHGDSRICNAGRLRLKESDRLATTAKLIAALGGEAEEMPDGLLIHGSGKLRGGIADSCNDHRIAMSAAVAACLCCESVTVTGAQCVEKSYPAFWEDYGRCSP